MKKSMCLLVLGLIVSCKQNQENDSLENSIPDEKPKIETAALSIFTPDEVAKYCIASVMGQSPKIINVENHGDLYFVSYVRKSDKQKFEYKVKIVGTNIIWASVDGKWRDNEFDEKISYFENGNKLQIIQTFSDNSHDIQEYIKGD